MVDKEMKEKLLNMTTDDKATVLELLVSSLCDSSNQSIIGKKAESLLTRFNNLSTMGKIKVLNATLNELKTVEAKEKKIGKK